MKLKTNRLIIRNYKAEDLQDLYDIFGDPEVMEYCEPPYSFEKVKEFIEHYGLKETPKVFAVVEKKSNKVIGHALFGQLTFSESGIYEIGWIFNKHYWRKGYAYEMATKLLNYGFNELNLHKVVAETIDPIKSVSLMKKLNMRKEGVFRKHEMLNQKWYDLYWYAILRNEYLKKEK